MKKIGILTHYHNSLNYGGVLQAYALQRVCQSLDYTSEVKQVDFDYLDKALVLEPNRNKGNYFKLKNKMKVFYSILQNKIIYYTHKNSMDVRIDRFKRFRAKISHTQYYNFNNIEFLTNYFNILITGSDQVWNPNCFNKYFYLSFKSPNTARISYSASMSVKKLSDYQKKHIIPLINNLDYISVRENSTKILIQSEVNKNIKTVLDPTLLLDHQKWDELLTNVKKYEQPYIFVYLLGNNLHHRDIIKEIARLLNYQIIFIPHVQFAFRKEDLSFADVEVYDAGPVEFIELIRNANLVITDSFHGCAFSIIYHKSFWALRRDKDSNPENMNSRLYNLFNDLNIPNRFLEDQKFNKADEIIEPIDYTSVEKRLDICRKESIEWLKTSIEESYAENQNKRI